MRAHTFKLEHRDGLGRRWCAVCRLPEGNDKAKSLHSQIHRQRRPEVRDWRSRAYDRGSAEE